MFYLQFQNRQFSTLEDFQNIAEDYPDFLLEALQFCRDWQSGEAVFQQKTSGSTGAPKVLSIHRNQMQASARATGEFFKVNPRNLLLCCLNPAFIAGKMMLVRAMEWQAPILLQAPQADPLKDLNSDQIPDFIAMVPLQVQESLKNPKSRALLQKVSHLIIGGAASNPQLREDILKYNLKAYQTYGMTETVSHIALAKITEQELIYYTLPGVEIGLDERETLWVKGPMSLGNRIQTNDQVKLISDRSFIWLGRVDFVINSGGIKLHPELLEQRMEKTIHTHFPSSRFFLAGIPDPKFGEKMVLVLETEMIEIKKAKLLQEELKLLFQPYELPKDILTVNKFQETPSGKVDRIRSLPL